MSARSIGFLPLVRAHLEHFRLLDALVRVARAAARVASLLELLHHWAHAHHAHDGALPPALAARGHGVFVNGLAANRHPARRASEELLQGARNL